MTTTEFIVWCALIGLAGLCSAILSAFETVILVLKEHRVRALAEKHPSLAEILDDLKRHANEYLTHALTLGSATNLFVALTTIYLFRESGWFPVQGSAWWVKAILIVSGMVFILDCVPKCLAARSPALVCRLAGRPFRNIFQLTSWVIRPINRLVARTTERVIPEHIKPRTRLTIDELIAMAELRGESGTLTPIECQMIKEVLLLEEKTVRDCMTARAKTLTIKDDTTPQHLRAQLNSTFHHWIPVFGESADQIVHLLDSKAFFAAGRNVGSIQAFLTQPLFVPETMPALEVLYQHLIRQGKTAVVVNEFGDYEGVINRKDILEDILEDSLPDPNLEDVVQVLGDGKVFRVKGEARLEDLSKLLKLPLERDGLDTISGLIFNELGHLPTEGTIIHHRGMAIKILKASGQQIEQLELEKVLT